MDTSDLAKRMKNYEIRDRYFLQKRIPVAIRVDMRAGHTFTKGFERPFDKVFMKSMQETAKYMCENMGNAKFAYVQSDEITIILVDYDTLKTDCWFNYRTDKLCSISASMATMAFNKFFEKNVEIYIQNCATDYETQGLCGEGTIEYDLCKIYQKALEKGAMFDARVFNIPKEEVANLIYWRQLDAARNSVQMVGQANFSHSELQGKTCNMIQDMLLTQKDINWNNFPIDCKRGAACIYDNYQNPDSITNGDIIKGWRIDREMPIIKDENREYVEKYIYIGEGM